MAGDRPRRTKRVPSKLEAEADDVDLRRAIQNSLKQQRRVERRVPQAPVFHPTAEEFADPLSYIARITPEAQASGICKIIPPDGFAPKTKAPDSASKIFKTKRQLTNRLQEGIPFKEGRKVNVQSYREYAQDFAQQTLAQLSAKHEDFKPTESCLERAFWQIVETNCEDLSVDYANDLDNVKYGSGFEWDPDHQWNLNTLHRHAHSLLKTLDIEVSGVTKPWLYYGALFAAFCWHTEDHFLYSINYMHEGSAKSWYGIPDSSALKFEHVLKQHCPDRFKESPDLIYQLVSLLSPSHCLEQGVKVVHTVQHAGEFIVTFPNGYHAGFSHGFNCSEAVNFSIPEWLPYGTEAIAKYHKQRGSKRAAVFPHDQLLWKLTYKMIHVLHKHLRPKEEEGGGVAWPHDCIAILAKHTGLSMERTVFYVWLLQYELGAALAEEMHMRDWLEGTGMRCLHNKDYDTERAELCCVCGSMPYFSSVVCEKHNRVTCPKHAFFQCDCEAADKQLRVTVTDAQLKNVGEVAKLIKKQVMMENSDTVKADVGQMSSNNGWVMTGAESRSSSSASSDSSDSHEAGESTSGSGGSAEAGNEGGSSESLGKRKRDGRFVRKRTTAKEQCAICSKDLLRVHLRCVSCDSCYHTGCVSTSARDNGPFVCEFCRENQKTTHFEPQMTSSPVPTAAMH